MFKDQEAVSLVLFHRIQLLNALSSYGHFDEIFLRYGGLMSWIIECSLRMLFQNIWFHLKNLNIKNEGDFLS